jgi:hypothetical protein
VFSICLRRRERVERRCPIDETDKTSEKYYPKTLIIKIVQNHLLFLCIILLTLVFSDFADRIAGIRFDITIDYPCNVTGSITLINSIKIIITSQAKHQSINRPLRFPSIPPQVVSNKTTFLPWRSLHTLPAVISLITPTKARCEASFPIRTDSRAESR